MTIWFICNLYPLNHVEVMESSLASMSVNA